MVPNTRVLRIGNRVLIEGQDALTIAEGEEITLTRWGNVKVSAMRLSVVLSGGARPKKEEEGRAKAFVLLSSLF